MSLFKSFSKSKEVSAKDSEAEQKSSTEEKGQSKTAKEDSQANGSKELENPTKEKEEKESGQRPFGKLFKSKSIKEPADSAVDGKSEKETPLSQAVETAKQDAKNIVVAVQQEVVAQLEPQNELSKAKEMDAPSNQKSKEPGQSPFSKLFKSKDGPESATATVDVKSPNVESTSNALSPAKEGSKHSDPSEKEKLAEESKPAKSGLMSFFKQLKLDITDGKGNKRAEAAEKTDVSSTTESSPSIQKGKDKSKDKKKAAAEQNKEKDNKQEVKQAQETPTAAQLQNAVTEPTTDSEDKDAKKAEKKSFGDFFKALSVKKTCDAEVQTDLVTILPAEK